MTVDTYGIPEFFCEALHGVSHVGPCRRLLFTVYHSDGDRRMPLGVVKLVFPAEALADIARMLAADAQTPATVLASLRTSARAN
jgi:hypothetical protein